MTSPFVVGDVVFRPSDFAGTITNDWATVSLCTTDFAPYGDKAVDHLNQIHNTTNFAKGIGDICRYMGIVDGSTWRIPTAKEWAELYGSAEADKGQAIKLGNGWVDGNYYPLSGLALGPGRHSVSIIGDGIHSRVTNADPNINGAVFLVSAGDRDYTAGAIWWIGSCGYYWSSTASTADRGYDMEFNSSNVYPQQSNSRTWAFTIRCIRE